jgi:hypothetical protein
VALARAGYPKWLPVISFHLDYLHLSSSLSHATVDSAQRVPGPGRARAPPANTAAQALAGPRADRRTRIQFIINNISAKKSAQINGASELRPFQLESCKRCRWCTGSESPSHVGIGARASESAEPEYYSSSSRCRKSPLVLRRRRFQFGYSSSDSTRKSAGPSLQGFLTVTGNLSLTRSVRYYGTRTAARPSQLPRRAGKTTSLALGSLRAAAGT